MAVKAKYCGYKDYTFCSQLLIFLCMQNEINDVILMLLLINSVGTCIYTYISRTETVYVQFRS